MNFTALELEKKKTIDDGEYGSLKIQTPTLRVWLAKEGFNFSNEITVERLVLNKWMVLRVYPG